MTVTKRISIVLITFATCLSVQRGASAQSGVAGMMPNSAPEVKLIATMNPIFIEGVEFEGLTKVSVTEVAREFKNKRINVTKDAVLVPTNVQEAAKIITQMLASVGYLNADVDVKVEDVKRRSKRVTFVVNEGRPSVVKGIEFQGNKVFSDYELRSQLVLTTSSNDDIFERAKLYRDLNRLTNYMHARGYLEADYVEPTLQTADGVVTIIVPIEEGRLFRIGEITVKGTTRLTPEQIVEVIDLKPGDVADARKLNDGFNEELGNFYGNIGYPEVSLDIETEYRVIPNVENEGIVDVRISIDTGTCYKIGSIEFRGNKSLATQDLQRFLLFKEGDTYNRQLIFDSFKALRESGLVQPIGLEADADYRFDEETGLVAVIIRVQEL